MVSCRIPERKLQQILEELKQKLPITATFDFLFCLPYFSSFVGYFVKNFRKVGVENK